MSKIPIAGTEEKQAIETIKERWVEQGIWKEKWDEMAADEGIWVLGSRSMKNRLSWNLNRRHTQKLNLHLQLSVFLVYLRSRRSRNRDGRRAMTRGGRLRSDEPYGNGNVRPYVRIISSSIRYRRSANEPKTNQPMGKALTLPTSTRGHTKTSRTPGQSEGFGTEDGVYYRGCRGSMNGLSRRKPPTILHLF
jgi:hypothetical protein